MDIECFPMCRVCMQESTEFYDFDMPLQTANEEDTNITYLDFFFECTRIEVEPHERGSQCFCVTCGDELSSFYKFIKIAEMSDRLLKAKHYSFDKKRPETNNPEPYTINEGNLECIQKHYSMCSNEETIQFMSEETHKLVMNENHRLIKLQVEPVHKTKLKALDCVDSGFSDNSEKIIDTAQSFLREDHGTKKRAKSKTGPAECVFCHEILRNQKLLDHHLIEEHKRRTKPCKICGKMVIRMRDHLLIHEREKQSIQRPKVECTICLRMISKQAISRHIRHVHNREANYKCTECSQTFADAHKLKVHLLKGHNAKMNIKCAICVREFGNATSLRNHLRVHHCLKSPSGT